MKNLFLKPWACLAAMLAVAVLSVLMLPTVLLGHELSLMFDTSLPGVPLWLLTLTFVLIVLALIQKVSSRSGASGGHPFKRSPWWSHQSGTVFGNNQTGASWRVMLGGLRYFSRRQAVT